MKPIKIIGGGLAGLALGGALQEEGIATTICEAGTYPRHRVCGEFITGLDPADADQLRLGPLLQGAHRLSTVSWFRHGQKAASFQLPNPALGLSRHCLDARMVKRFEGAGGDLQTHTRISEFDDRPGLIRTNGHRVSKSPYLGLKAHFKGLKLQTDLEMHLGDHAYVGLSPVEGGVVNLCGLFRRRPINGSLPDLLLEYLRQSGFEALAAAAGSGEVVAGSACAVAGLDYSARPANGDTLSLGDAWQLIPPFTGAGMGTAFTAAAEALPIIRAYGREQMSWSDSQEAIRARLARRLSSRMRAARLVHPFLLDPKRQTIAIMLARLNLLPLGFLYKKLH